MTIFQIECFLTVAEFLNFAKAAEQMNISQPAITRQIQSLENELGGKLFQRSTRVVRLTENGHIFKVEAQTIVAAARRSIRRFSMNDKEEIQDFDIGCSNSLQLQLLENILPQLRELHPNIHPRLHIMREPYFTEQLEEENIDIAIGFQVAHINSSLQYRELRKAPFTWICREDCPLASLETVGWKDFDPFPMVLLSLGTAPQTVISGQRLWASKKKPSQLYFSRSIESMLLLVKTGFGITLLPDIYTPQDSVLKKIPLSGSERFSFGLYYKTLGKPYMKDFIRLLTAQFSSETAQTPPDGGAPDPAE